MAKFICFYFVKKSFFLRKCFEYSRKEGCNLDNSEKIRKFAGWNDDSSMS